MLTVDKLNKKEIIDLQQGRMKHLVAYLYDHSPFYRRLFRSEKISPERISKLGDLSFFPTTSKEDLQIHNMDFLCVPPEKIVDFTTTSGTLGTPVTIALTRNDLNRLAYNEYLSFKCAGAGSKDVFQLALTLDKQFMAGMAYYLGALRLKAGVARTGPGAPSLQWDMIFRVGTTTLVVVPSFILNLIEYARENNIDFNSSPVRRAICIGENVRSENFEYNTIGERIRQQWDIQLVSTYASTEMQTAFTECTHGLGGHLHPELLIAEVLDDDGNQVKEGERGELTITTLGVEGMPLLRYRTGDICTYFSETCPCGRHSMRISPILGRKQHIIKYKGTTIYPSVIYEVLNGNPSIIDYVLEVNSNELDTDDVKIWMAVRDSSDQSISKLVSYLHASLRVMPKIEFADPDRIKALQMQGMGRKAQRFLDLRTSGRH